MLFHGKTVSAGRQEPDGLLESLLHDRMWRFRRLGTAASPITVVGDLSFREEPRGRKFLKDCEIQFGCLRNQYLAQRASAVKNESFIN